MQLMMLDGLQSYLSDINKQEQMTMYLHFCNTGLRIWPHNCDEY